MNYAPRLLLASAFLAATANAQILLMPDTTSDTLVSFSPVDGSVINTNQFALPNETLISAIDVNGEIWVSSQSGDTVYRFDFVGTPLGQIGPTFAGGGLDNIRGINYIGGLVFVTNNGTLNGAPGSAVIVFDPAGNYLYDFPTTGLVPSPFSVIPYQGDILVAGSSGGDDMHRFTLAGTPVGTFHDSASLSFGHQCAPATDGNTWCAGFTSDNVLKLDAAGQILEVIPTNNTRGIFELYNGNLLWTDSTGVYVYDPLSQSSSLVHAGGGRHLNLFGGIGANPAKISYYGDGCDGLQTTTMGGPTLGNLSFELVATNVPTVSPVAFMALGNTQVEPGIGLGIINMPGCFSYTSFDVGLFSTGAVVAGASSLSLPIPNNPVFIGAVFAAQSVSFSGATPLGLAAGNGLRVQVGN